MVHALNSLMTRLIPCVFVVLSHPNCQVLLVILICQLAVLVMLERL